MERRNDERLKAVIRHEMEALLATQEETLRSYMEVSETTRTQLFLPAIADTEQRIAFLRWVIHMYRPSDPNTINQWNMTHGKETATVT